MSGDSDRLVAAIRGYVDPALDEIHRRLDELPAPRDGRDGVNGERGERGEKGERGEQGIAGVAGQDGAEGRSGRDGVGVAGATVNRDGDLILTLSNGDILTLGRVDGRDGLGFDELELEHDGDRTVVFRFVRGELVRQFPVIFPVPIYRGVYQPEKGYQRGDMVTFGGSLWHCNAGGWDKPGEGSSAWTLAAKRGRDGKPAKGIAA